MYGYEQCVCSATGKTVLALLEFKSQVLLASTWVLEINPRFL